MKLPPKKKSSTSENSCTPRSVEKSGLGAHAKGETLTTEGAPPSNTAPYNCINDKSTKILRCSIDSLYLSYTGSLYEDWNKKLQTLKMMAQSDEEMEKAQAQVAIGRHLFEVMGRGDGRFPYVLQDGALRIALSKPEALSMPLAYAQLSSESLTFSDVETLEADLKFVVNTIGNVIDEPKNSRVDLCIDFVTNEPLEDINDHAWVSRAHLINRYSNKRNFSGWVIGSGGAMSARLYDKTLEIKKSKKDYLKDIWKSEGWDEKQTVWRLEFQFRREVLKQLNILSVPDLLSHLKNLWEYATHDWLRLTVPNSKDETQTRWPNHPLWEILSNAPWECDNPIKLKRTHLVRPPTDESLFVNGLGGITSFMAREGITDLGEGFGEYLHHARLYHDRQERFTGNFFGAYVDLKVKQKGRKFNTLNNIVTDKDELKQQATNYRKGKDGE